MVFVRWDGTRIFMMIMISYDFRGLPTPSLFLLKVIFLYLCELLLRNVTCLGFYMHYKLPLLSMG